MKQWPIIGFLGCALLVACTKAEPEMEWKTEASERAAPAFPAMLTGNFEDDYGNRYDISSSDWIQLPHGHFRIAMWDAEAMYLIAQNDSSNAYAPEKWTRIDWMILEDMAPYDWAFCLSAYEADTREEAEATQIADRTTPKTGCNGYPFTRMKR